jgi:hypothetical protein
MCYPNWIFPIGIKVWGLHLGLKTTLGDEISIRNSNQSVSPSKNMYVPIRIVQFDEWVDFIHGYFWHFQLNTRRNSLDSHINEGICDSNINYKVTFASLIYETFMKRYCCCKVKEQIHMVLILLYHNSLWKNERYYIYSADLCGCHMNVTFVIPLTPKYTSILSIYKVVDGYSIAFMQWLC